MKYITFASSFLSSPMYVGIFFLIVIVVVSIIAYKEFKKIDEVRLQSNAASTELVLRYKIVNDQIKNRIEHSDGSITLTYEDFDIIIYPSGQFLVSVK